MNNYPISQLKEINFTVLKNSEVLKSSVIMDRDEGITKNSLYQNDKIPVVGGIVDLRLGTTNRELKCQTCGLNENKCPGHFGHLKLNMPVFHTVYMKYILNLMSLTCHQCGTPKLSLDDLKEISKTTNDHEERFSVCVNKAKKVKQCINEDCKTPSVSIRSYKTSIRSYRSAETMGVKYTFKDEGKTKSIILNAQTCKEKLDLIPQEFYNFLGIQEFSPSDLIISIFPISPVAIRPSIRGLFLSNNVREDGLTHQLISIVKCNNSIKKITENLKNIDNKDDENRERFKLRTLEYNLQFYLQAYFDNSKSGIKSYSNNSSNSLIKSLVERWKGKEGLIRKNLMGKRANFIARAVITPDPRIGTNEMGFPISLARKLTYPEVVNEENIDRLTRIVRNGTKKYPGANYVIKTDPLTGRKRNISVAIRSRSLDIEIGDIVQRHLITGDYMLFNRQPSLHKMSTMTHRIKVIEDERLNTFRMNVSSTKPYGADFDGDAMNAHIPQSLMTSVELQEITDLKYQIISPANSKPCIQLVQDSILGAYLLTLSDEIKYDWKTVLDLISGLKNIDIDIPQKNNYTGKDIFSLIIPSQLHIPGIFENQKLLKTLNKSIINKILIREVWDNYNPNITIDFIDNIQLLIEEYLLLRGITVGYQDIKLDSQLRNDVKKQILEKELDVDISITEIENNPTVVKKDKFENVILDSTSSLQSNVGKYIQDRLDYKTNNWLHMLNSGSKGGPSNLSKSMGVIGQVRYISDRIPNTLNGRSSPHTWKNNERANTRGLIKNSFFEGLDVVELFHNQMVGRIGLSDTAIKTADTGYLERMMVKLLENCCVKHDGTVRLDNGYIIQLLYGDCGLDNSKLRRIKLPLLKMSNQEIEKEYSYGKNDDYIDELITIRDNIRNLFVKYKMSSKNFDDTILFPMEIDNLINKVKNIKGKTNLTFNHIRETIQKIFYPSQECQILPVRKSELESSFLNEIDYHSKIILDAVIKTYLSPKKLIEKLKFKKENFDKLFELIVFHYKKAIIHPGEMVGTTAAQSIGEVTTQLTLDTFHKTGSGSAALSGVERLKQIIKLTESMKGPIIKIFYDSEINTDLNKVKEISSHLASITLKNILTDYQIQYVTNSKPIDNIIIDKKPIYTNRYGNFKKSELPWLIKCRVNKEYLFDKMITMEDIKLNFVKYFDDLSNKKLKTYNNLKGVLIESSSDLVDTENIYVHIYFDLIEINKVGDIIEMTKTIIERVKIRGISSVKEISYVGKSPITKFNKDGSLKESYEYMTIANSYMLKVSTKNNTESSVDSKIKRDDIEKIRYFNNIDLSRTITNDIVKTYKTFGVEACRKLIIKEILTVLESSDEYSILGDTVNYQHVELLADLMTSRGYLVQVSITGTHKLNLSPLSKISFEHVPDNMVKSTFFNRTDTLESVSGRVMFGQAIKGGTGYSQIQLNTDMIRSIKPNIQDRLEKIRQDETIEDEEEIDTFE